ncbi:MAG TPA: hypothetical protein VG941_02155 [Candidatus Paceibacterota bacterium]|nr:hypothetical protein [Candidatus Paceibacterota bacterium]
MSDQPWRAAERVAELTGPFPGQCLLALDLPNLGADTPRSEIEPERRLVNDERLPVANSLQRFPSHRYQPFLAASRRSQYFFSSSLATS